MRGYHGDHIQEKKWIGLFSRRLLSAVDMPPEYLAAHDGTEQASGRGSGLTTLTVNAEAYSRVPELPSRVSPLIKTANDLISKPYKDMTPYMQMMFAPLERRLDTAIFRAMFATSVRQARQFVVHGLVKVNGKKFVHPSYKLNPGDMFQVDIDRVLTATGAIKNKYVTEKKYSGKVLLEEKDNNFVRQRVIQGFRKPPASTPDNGEAGEGAAATNQAGDDALASDKEATSELTEANLSAEEKEELHRKQLEYHLYQARKILHRTSKHSRDRYQIHLFERAVQRSLPQPHNAVFDTGEMMEELVKQWEKYKLLSGKFKSEGDDEFAPNGRLPQSRGLNKRGFPLRFQGFSREYESGDYKDTVQQGMSREEIRQLKALIAAEKENPFDITKPYITPWVPRPYMAAFAFIPRYLEVNHELCAAVYLRHPVARKGRAEVPTPFHYLTSQLTYIWYLRRGNRSRL